VPVPLPLPPDPVPVPVPLPVPVPVPPDPVPAPVPLLFPPALFPDPSVLVPVPELVPVVVPAPDAVVLLLDVEDEVSVAVPVVGVEEFEVPEFDLELQAAIVHDAARASIIKLFFFIVSKFGFKINNVIFLMFKACLNLLPAL